MNFRNLIAILSCLTSSITCFPVPVPAQDDSFLGAAAFLSGASSLEELDESEAERYSHLRSNPLDINHASRSKLLSSGLLSLFQIASIEDYRSRSGDILSYSELATLPGFGEDIATALKPFITLESGSIVSITPRDSFIVNQDAVVRLSVRSKNVNYGAKYKINVKESFEASAAVTSSRKSFNAVYYGRKRLGKVIAGDFNARFGQGLALWSGLSLTGFSNSASFCKKANGLSPSWSYSGIGSHRGVAAEFRLGSLILSDFVSFPQANSPMPGTNLTWFGRNGQVGITGYYRYRGGGRISADFRFNRKGLDFFGEYAYDFKLGLSAWVAGASCPIGNDYKLNAIVRSHPMGFQTAYSGGSRAWTGSSGERGVALGLERFSACLTMDLAVKDGKDRQEQCKILFKFPFQLSEKSVLTVRFTERFRPTEVYLKYRTGGRLDLDWSSSGLSARYGSTDGPAWKVMARTEFLLCRSLGSMAYLEGGRVTERFSAYMRGTVFFVDNWDDRIYSYERDAPGNFNVPAYYGRGWSFSAIAGLKLAAGKKKYKALKLYFRASTVGYQFMRDPKPGRTEAKLQLMMSF